jgi:molecular chaperone GrpE
VSGKDPDKHDKAKTGGNGKPAGEGSPEGAEPSGLEAAPDPGPALAEDEALRREVAALRSETAELKDQLLRRRADFENYKKRVERDRESSGHAMAEKIFAELIPTIDNLERALAASGDDDALRAGVEMIHRELLAVFERHGVQAHDPTGQLFDPVTHQALSHEVVPGLEEGTVAESFRKGYSYRDRLLRPALVKVAKAEGEDDEDAETPATDSDDRGSR